MIKLPPIDYILNQLMLVFQMTKIGEENIFGHLKVTYFTKFFEKKVELHIVDNKLQTMVVTHYYRFTIPGSNRFKETTQQQRVVEILNLFVGYDTIDFRLITFNGPAHYFYIVDEECDLKYYEDSEGNFYDRDLMSDAFMFYHPVEVIDMIIGSLESRDSNHQPIPTRPEVALAYEEELSKIVEKYNNFDGKMFR